MAENSTGNTPGRPFEAGKTGNPRGRPPTRPEFRDRCRRFVDEHVIQAWEQEVKSAGDNWMKAAELIAAYGYGKPAQSVDVTSKGKSVVFRVDLSE